MKKREAGREKCMYFLLSCVTGAISKMTSGNISCLQRLREGGKEIVTHVGYIESVVHIGVSKIEITQLGHVFEKK